MKVESIAAIDVGSNAVRLLINNVEDYEERKALKKNAYIRVPLRLGEDVFAAGRLGEPKIEALVETMRSFRGLMNVFGVRLYRACATSAMREAVNGAEAAARVQRETGLQIEIISGAEEAELIFAAGCLEDLMSPEGHYLHVDVGGGSTEVVLYSRQRKIEARSFPIGTLRMLAGKVDPQVEDDFRRRLKVIGQSRAPLRIIASGGNINKTLKLLGKKDGETVGRDLLAAFHQELSALNFEERLARYQMNSYRADVIVPALEIFLTIGQLCNVTDYIIPKVGLADGIIQSAWSALDNAASAALPAGKAPPSEALFHMPGLR